jgi:hypothetical protein
MAAFTYGLILTGDCGNTDIGAFSLSLSGGTPPYSVQFSSPLSSYDVALTTSPILVSNLSASTYSARVNDSTLPLNNEYYINIPISSGVCASILNVYNTTCGLSNGSVSATTTSNSSSINSYLYTQSSQLVATKGSNSNTIIYENLSGGTYYIYIEDIGGCTAKTESFIVKTSSDFDFGYFSVKSSPCFSGSTGKIYITGETGTSPYTYNWSIPQTGNTVTGLTAGLYSVEVVDANNCSKTKTIEIQDASNLGVVSSTNTPPTCFNANGSISVTISGGTAPFYYLLDTGFIDISYEDTVTITGLTSGGYTLNITDAALCNISFTTTLSSVNSLTSVNIQGVNSTCSINGSYISIDTTGGIGPFTFGLINPSGNTITNTSISNNYIFSGLTNGTYTAYVSDTTGCYYSDEVILIAQDKYSLNHVVTNTTCGTTNGSVLVTITSGGTAPYNYYLGNDFSILDTNLTAYTFNNVSIGQYTLKVVDSLGCEQTKQISIGQSSGVEFNLYPISCTNGNDGGVNVFISEGKPPFTFNWSNNVPNNPQSISVSNLSGGTVSLTLVDSDGCSLTKSTNVTCFKAFTSTQTYTIDTKQFVVQPIASSTLLEVLNEGFNDLSLGNPSCYLNSAIYELIVELTPMSYSASTIFFTGDSRINVPSNSEYADVLKTIVGAIPGVESVEYDLFTNKVTIVAEPNNQTILSQVLTIRLKITYDIICTS